MSGGIQEAPPSSLLPYVPRLAVDWLSSAPDERYRRVDGTMVFVDVSGFTALSERLAKRGKAGAEELTQLLDGIFTGLLTRAKALGGGLVKFGGDALLLLFEGEGHARRGCAAAHDMRAELAAGGGSESSAGPVRLKMSVGVHSGAFDFFLVGDSHRELLLTGPAASGVVAAEAAAEADQIVISRATAAHLERAATAPLDGNLRLLLTRPAAEPEPRPPRLDAGPPMVEQAVPTALRRHLVTALTEAEHRMVTVGFLHFMGVDELLATQGPGAVADALERVITTVQHHLDGNTVCLLGSDVYGDGGKLILAAGVPEATENDEERLLRALRAIFDRDLPLAMRAGVNRGHVYAGDVGPAVRRTYTVMGDAVNLAARLMQAAGPGEILVTQGALARSATDFGAEPLEPFYVKGKARPVQAFRLGRPLGRKRRQTAARLPLIGRVDEMKIVEDCLGAARAGRGSTIAVIGPGGIGKSRLAEEIRSVAQDMTTLTVLCEQYEAEAAYWPLQWLVRRILDVPLDADARTAGEALEAAVERIAPELLPWLPLLAIPAHADVPTTRAVDELDNAFRRDRLERVTTEVLSRALTSPTLILVEDLHWMDEASRSLIRRLCENVAEHPWVIALTTRDDDLELLSEQLGDSLREIRLGPLDEGQAQILAVAASDLAPLPPHAVVELAERAGGSPLFLLELVAGAMSVGTDELPETIEAAITARIDTLDPADRLVLRCAAVLGIAFSVDLARETLQQWIPAVRDPVIWERLGEFLSKEGEDRLRFRHALVRDVAYEGLPYRRRRVLHGLVGTRLEALAGEQAEERAEVLCLHFLRAERYREAWKYAVIAGDRARSKAANVDAAGFYRHALDAAQKVEEAEPVAVAALAEQLGDVCELGGLYQDALRAYRTARRLLRGHQVNADLYRKEGLIQERLGRYPKAQIMYRESLRLARAIPDHATAARAQVALAGALYYEGRFRAALWWARRAAMLAAEHDVPEVLAHAFYLIDYGYTDLGDQAAAKEYRGLALPIYERLGDLVGQVKVLNNLGGNAYIEGQWNESVEFYERGLRAAERAGDTVHVAMLSSNIAEVLLQQGHLEEAERLLKEALQTQRGTGHRLGEAWSLCNLGVVAARSGRLDEAYAILSQAREKFSEMSAEAYALEATGRLAEVHLIAGDHRNARMLLDQALKDVDARGGLVLEAMMRRLEAYALRQAGRHEVAVASLEESLRVAEAANATYEMALTLEAMARLGLATGEPKPVESLRARALLEDLGVVETPAIPLGAGDVTGNGSASA